MSTLLADIVASRRLQPEPVATDALVHLLGRSPAGRIAVTDLVATLTGSAVDQPLTFTAQVVTADDQGRPDVVGSDHLGPRLILEAKFDAELTAIQQTDAYERRLTGDAPGALLYLVPDDRLRAIWAELLAGPGAGHQAPTHADGPTRSCLLPSGNTLAATSWTHLLAVLREALGVAGDSAGLADLAQIDGLVAWRGRVGWTPVVPGDLPTRSGRQLSALVPALLAAAQQSSSTKVRNGSGDQGPGRYISSPGGHTLWVGMWLSWWARHGESPLWAQIRAADGTPVDLIAAQLAGLPRVVPRPEHGDVLVPLVVPPGAELETVTEQLTGQLRDITACLATVPTASVSAATTPEPSE
ncbi:hypothetical protein AB0N29_01710 [Nocardioides sp. NPDC092400]|uniref:hypothetical protein n=1 Tax=Nocardioides sp. NPDC092400 TaxID=3155196 RepID=UPI00342353B5